MKRILVTSALCLCTATASLAETVEERLVAGLKAQGYVILEDGYTFFGRLRIVAENATLHREIVVNPETGEVLRDYAMLITDDAGQVPKVAASQGSDHSGAATATVALDPGSGPGGPADGTVTATTVTATVSMSSDPGADPGRGEGELVTSTLLGQPIIAPGGK